MRDGCTVWRRLAPLVERAQVLDIRVHHLFDELLHGSGLDERDQQGVQGVYDKIQGLHFISWRLGAAEKAAPATLDDAYDGAYLDDEYPAALLRAARRLLELERELATPAAPGPLAPEHALEHELSRLTCELAVLVASPMGRLVAEYRRLSQAPEHSPETILAESVARELARLEEIYAFTRRFQAGDIDLDTFVRGPSASRLEARIRELVNDACGPERWSRERAKPCN